MLQKKSHWILLACCVVVLVITGTLISGTFTDNGKYTVEETSIALDGYTLSGNLYVPKAALAKDEAGNFINKVPAVAAQGGGGTTRSVQEDIAIQLVKRGFVVFTFDAFNHGLSDRYDWGSHRGSPGFRHVDNAVNYLQSLEFVDKANIGYTGHSQGMRAAMFAASRYAGYYTLQDLLMNMLHDELGVTITAEQVAAQNADAIAAQLDDYQQGYYNGRKVEIAEEIANNRVRWVLGQGGVANSTVVPKVVEVAGNSVFRDIQSNIAFCMPLQNDTNLVPGEKAEPIDYTMRPNTRLAFGTGEGPVESWNLYRVNMSADDQQAPGTLITRVDTETWTDAAVREAAAKGSLRMQVTFPGWHTVNYRNQENIDAICEFASISTGFNNGYLASTGGSGAVPMGEATWRIYDVANVVGLIALLLMMGLIAVLMLRSRFTEPILAEPSPALLTKKDPINWISLLVVVLLPLFLMAVSINNQPFTSSAFPMQHNRTSRVLFWALVSTAALVLFMIVKWNVLDKKKYSVSFSEFYGLKVSRESLLISVIYAFVVYTIIYGIIWFYQDVFDGAAFNLMYFNIVHFKIISTERYLDFVMYAIYFLPFWIVSGMFVNSFRMSDMPDWQTTAIQAVLNCLGIGAYVFIQYMGYVWTGGTEVVLGLDWNSLYLVVGLVIALPAAVVYSRLIYNRTGSVLTGAFLNTLIFTLIQMNNVVGD